MNVGILSDSHGLTERVEAAARLFASHKTQAVVHCGDITRISHLSILADCNCPLYLAAGNMDCSKEYDLRCEAERLGVTFSDSFVVLDASNGIFLAATHGDRRALLDQLINDDRYKYVCHGHTHQQKDKLVGQTRLINPGSLYAPAAGEEPSIALLETDTGALQRFAIP